MYTDCWNCNMDCSIHECTQKMRDLEKRVMDNKTPTFGLAVDDVDVNLIKSQIDSGNEQGFNSSEW